MKKTKRKKKKELKVAIVHDWLVGGGAERVVYELHQMFPDAPIYTSYCTAEWREKLDGKVVTGWLQHWPFSRLRKFLPVLRIWWFTRLDFSGYDLVISSSGNGEAKGIRVPKGTEHICYCHSPTHFYWRHYDQYMKRPGFGFFDPLARLGLKLLVGPLRAWDLRAAKRPDHIIANSTHIKRDIKKYYGRVATVIHPPVDVKRFQEGLKAPSQEDRRGFVTLGRQVPHKHTDIIVQACTKVGVPLKVIGDGPEHNRLLEMAGRNVTFFGYLPDGVLPEQTASAEAFLFASFDDFGITPIEAMAAGTPVIAYKAGGALDYVEPGKTGEFFTEQTAESLAKTILAFKVNQYSDKTIRKEAEKFSTDHFRRSMRRFISKHVS